ncbi:MAG: GGDEF domain-containing protein [Gammaproteobacteria bacterium]|nr:GGDEF domain-containing protein [Gammaproteobacteria bacterium]MBU1481369.1 GGDEF domain-containing protein [Gammaproteobacteria bacterium]
MADNTEIQSAPDDDRSEVYTLSVRALAERIHLANILSPLGTLFLVWYEKDTASLSSLFAWAVSISLIQAVTFGNTGRLLRHSIPEEKVRYWHNGQTVWSVLEGMCWGSAAIFFHSAGSANLVNDVTVLIVIIIVACLSIFALAPSYRTFISFTSSALLVPAAFYFWSGDINNTPYIIGIFTLLLALVILGRVSNRDFVEGVRRLVLIQRISKQLEQRNRQLDDLNRQLNAVAIHDQLTGLYNRHFIVDQLERQHESFARYGNACSIVMVDIDLFKQVNDRYGHLVGDEVLVAFSRLMESMMRQGDLIGRFGGEEFLLVLPMTDAAEATQLAQRIHARLASAPLVDQPAMLVVTASFGVAQIRNGESIDDWLQRSDQAMYRAKESGRNCVRE